MGEKTERKKSRTHLIHRGKHHLQYIAYIIPSINTAPMHRGTFVLTLPALVLFLLFLFSLSLRFFLFSDTQQKEPPIALVSSEAWSNEAMSINTYWPRWCPLTWLTFQELLRQQPAQGLNQARKSVPVNSVYASACRQLASSLTAIRMFRTWIWSRTYPLSWTH